MEYIIETESCNRLSVLSTVLQHSATLHTVDISWNEIPRWHGYWGDPNTSTTALCMCCVQGNLRMVRPSSMSVVKLLIICVRKVCGKILDLARYAVMQVMLSLHFSFKLGVTIMLPPYLARNLKFDKILRKHLRFSYCNQGHDLYHARTRLKMP